MMWIGRREFFFGVPSTGRFQIISPLSVPGNSGWPLSIQLHPASVRKKVFRGSKVAGEVLSGPRNNFQTSVAKCTCDDYFYKEADSQLGGWNRYSTITSELCER
ncbi:uncharacterized protein TNCV_2981411 [Trichonephila clavipes]|nr:uncharacterized protein TNCV_2981411 [Trichonephila clavipes]